MLICGVDEAGRGPVIGPMVFAAVVIERKHESRLKKLGVTDSKLLDPETRIKLSHKIRKLAVEHALLSLSAADITEWMKSASLNEIEAIKTAELLDSLNITPDVCYVDCPDTIPARYCMNISNLCKKPVRIVAEHKADLNYCITGAASILAKVARDAAIAELAKEHGELGTGYPSDPVTQRWLDGHWKKNRSFPDIVRKKWSTVDRRAQLRLTDW